MTVVMEKRTKVGKKISTVQYRRLGKKESVTGVRSSSLSIIAKKIKQNDQIPYQITLH
jgi:hypothetical protein